VEADVRSKGTQWVIRRRLAKPPVTSRKNSSHRCSFQPSGAFRDNARHFLRPGRALPRPLRVRVWQAIRPDLMLEATVAGPMSTETPDEVARTRLDNLALNRAGQGVDAQAKRLRKQAPVRTLFARALGVHTEERAFRVGAKGERLVGEQLGRLPPPWHTLHSITLSEGGTDLDHLVIGPAGVFSVNTKYHPDANVWVASGTFLVNGQRQDYVRASRAEGRKVARLLTKACGFEVHVTPVIAVVGAGNGFKVKEQPAGVVVCTRRRIAEWLRSLPPELSSGEVGAIYSVACLPSTWA
jgi:hypothetical protein